MSLINDALKRAQTDVERGRINPLSNSITGVRPRAKKKGSFLVILTIILVVGLGGWALALLILPDKDKEPSLVVDAAPAEPVLTQAPPAKAIEVSPTNQVSIAAPVEEPATSEPEAPAPAQVFAAPAPIVETVETVVNTPAPVTAQIPAATLVEPAPSPAAVSESAPQTPPEMDASALNDEIVFTLKQVEITAVMGDGMSSRIMMGGQVFKSGELINLDLKIRFMGKKGNLLLFSDAFNRVYEKNL